MGSAIHPKADERPCFAPYWTAQKRRNELAEPTKVDRG
jgi:hypothetical protein